MRNENIDYTNGSFFITICTYNRKCVLGHIAAGMGLCPIRLTYSGNVVASELSQLQNRFTNIKIRAYCIMPNHIHFIIDIEAKRMGQSPIPAENSVTTVAAVVGALKSITTKIVNKMNGTPGAKLWQSGYWDDKIKSINDYAEIRRYIDDNPRKWAEDKYFVKEG